MKKNAKTRATLANKKIKIARELLGYSLAQACRESGWNPSSLSRYEKGLSKCVSRDYLAWLVRKRIDLVALFNNVVDAKIFEHVTKNGIMASFGKLSLPVSCEDCKNKDEEIAMLSQRLTDLERKLTKMG